MLYVIGESHGALYDYNDNKYIQLPATTMHRIGISGLEGIVDTKIIDRGSHVLFVVGEIDIRCHIHKQVNQLKRPVDEVIDKLVYGYIKYIKSLEEDRSCTVVIRGITPPLDVNIHNDEQYPIRGSLQERKEWREILNKRLEYESNLNNIIYLPSPTWAEKDGLMLHEFSDGIIHIDTTETNKMRAINDLNKLLNQPF
jgi:hypothetical protein